MEQETVATGCTRNDEKEKEEEQSSRTHNPGPLQTGLSQNTFQIRTETEMEYMHVQMNRRHFLASLNIFLPQNTQFKTKVRYIITN